MVHRGTESVRRMPGFSDCTNLSYPSNMKILVVEDEVTTISFYRIVLTKAGHQIIVARNGLEAANYLEGDTVDAVIVDRMMPVQDGLTLMRWVRDKIHPLPYLIMITTIDLPNARKQALEAGADEYLAKPVTPVELRDVVEGVWKKQSQK